MDFFKKLFGGKDNKDSKLTDNEKILQYLQKEMAERKILTEITNNSLHFPEFKMSLRAWIHNKTQHPNAVVMQMNFVLSQEQFDDDIFEALAGIGEDDDDAIKNGIFSFVAGPFDAIMESFHEMHDPEIDFETQLEGELRIWHPKIGPLQVQGQKNAGDTDGNRIFSILKNDIKLRIGDKKFYWIKAYVSRQADGSIITQCTINNEHFADAEDRMREYAKGWDNGNWFSGEKQYIIIRQCDKTWRPSKYSKDEIHNCVAGAISIMEGNTEYDDLLSRIYQFTEDEELAFELFCLIPEFYCQFVLPEVKYSDEMLVFMEDGTQKSLYISQSYIYGQIKKNVFELLRTNYDKDKVQKILCYGASIKAINDALLDGSKLEDLIMASAISQAPKNYNPFR